MSWNLCYLCGGTFLLPLSWTRTPKSAFSLLKKKRSRSGLRFSRREGGGREILVELPDFAAFYGGENVDLIMLHRCLQARSKAGIRGGLVGLLVSLIHILEAALEHVGIA